MITKVGPASVILFRHDKNKRNEKEKRSPVMTTQDLLH